MSSDPASASSLDKDLLFDAVDLVGNVGSHRRVERTLTAPAREIGGSAMQVPEGEDLAVAIELESVIEGVYVHGTVTAHLEGECSRCLDPVEQDVAARLDELYMFSEKVKADEREDTTMLTGDDVDLGPLVRDALAMAAVERPLCREDCPGLCSQCGFRMEDDPDHHHDVIDDRFAALQGLFDEPTDTAASEGQDAPTEGEGR